MQWHRYVPNFHNVDVRVPVRLKVGSGDGNTMDANTTGEEVAESGLQVTNDAQGYGPEDYEAEDDGGEYAPLDKAEQVQTDAAGAYVMRPQEEIESEQWVMDYVHWRDFGWTPGARTWAEVYCVWRKVYMTRSELVGRFGKEIGDAIRLDYSGPKSQGQDSQNKEQQFYKKATIYEIWDSTNRRTCWLAKSYDGDLLDDRPYPLKLSGRFPCQKPVFATQTNTTVAAVPDYLMYQDQAQEMDRLTQRLYVMMDALQVKFLYPGNSPEIQKLLQDAGELDGIPIETSLLQTVNGDLSKLVWFWPVDVLIKAMNELLAARERVKQDAYEITGISDIARGATDPNETATAQQLKAQTGAVRVRDRQQNFAQFVRDGLRIGSDIIVNHFTPESIAQVCDLKTVPESDWVKGPNGEWTDPKQLAMMAPPASPPMPPASMATAGAVPPGPPSSGAPAAPMPGVPAGIPIPPQPPMGHNGGPPMPPFDPTQTLGHAAIALLKDPMQRQFRIDVETDSTIALDQTAEKQARTEFVTAIGGFLEAAVQIAATPMGAELGPMLGEILLFAVRGFKVGSQLEGAIETAIEGLQAKAKNPAPPPPDPAMIKAQADAAATQAQAKNDQMKMQGELAIQQAESQREGQVHQMALTHEAVARQGEIAAEQQRAQTDAQAGRLDLMGKGIDLASKHVDLQIAEARLKDAMKPKPTNGSAG